MRMLLIYVPIAIVLITCIINIFNNKNCNSCRKSALAITIPVFLIMIINPKLCAVAIYLIVLGMIISGFVFKKPKT